jgi:hypothetical protein
MNQQLKINEEYWNKRNPSIIRSRPNKAYYGTYLIRVDLDINGASMRFHEHDVPLQQRTKGEPTYDQFLRFVKRQTQLFNVHKLIRTVDNRYVHVRRVTLTNERNNGAKKEDRIYDARVLYNEHKLLLNKPTDVTLSRQMDRLRIYSNNEQSIIDIIDFLEVDDSAIRLIGYPDPERIDDLLSGKEYSDYATDFQYKVYLRPVAEGGIEALSDYLEGVKNTEEVGVPNHTRLVIAGKTEKWGWARYTRSYLYAKDKNTVLLIQMLAGNKFSKAVELVPTDDNIDK